MIRRRPIVIAFAGALALVCCLGIGGGLAAGTQTMGAWSMPAAKLRTSASDVVLAAQELPLPQASIDLSGLGRAYGMRPGSAFAGNFWGGFVGAGLGGLLLGGGFFGGMHGGPGVLGVLAQLLLVYSICSWTLGRCSRTLSPAESAAFARLVYPDARRLRGVVRPGFFGGGRAGRPISLNTTDFRAFEEVLHCLQSAWCAQDMPAVRSLTTPEMAEAYLCKLSDLQCQNLRDVVQGLVIRRTELIEAWSDGNGDHATLQFCTTMIDATLDVWDRVVRGSLTEQVTLREYWSFERTGRGRWLVSAIERAG
jgi:predicted lipid-binding transport protein (Tim44 family)